MFNNDTNVVIAGMRGAQFLPIPYITQFLESINSLWLLGNPNTVCNKRNAVYLCFTFMFKELGANLMPIDSSIFDQMGIGLKSVKS